MLNEEADGFVCACRLVQAHAPDGWAIMVAPLCNCHDGRAIALVLDFQAWRTLGRQQGLDDEKAVE